MFDGGVTPGKVTNRTATFCTPVVPQVELCANTPPGLTAIATIAQLAANCRTCPGNFARRTVRQSRPNANTPISANASQLTSRKDVEARNPLKIAEEAGAPFGRIALLSSTAMSLLT